MKDFDAEYEAIRLVNGREEKVVVKRLDRAGVPAEERTFRIAGKEFVYRLGVRPEGFRQWSAMTAGEYVERDERGKAIRDEAGNVVSTLTEEQALKIMDDTVLAFLEPGQEETWRGIRAQEEDALTLEDVRALIRWLFEEQTARPTGRPSGSSNGSAAAETGTRSTDESSSPAAAA